MEENISNIAYSIDSTSASLEEPATTTQDSTSEESSLADENNYTLTLHAIMQEVTTDAGDGSKKTEQQALSLTQGTSVDLPDVTYKDAQGNESKVTALLTSLSFCKELYRPGCLEVVIETKAALSYFSGLVTLKYTENSVASNYYIFEKKKKAEYVTLRAYSVDQFLTIDLFCQAFTGKKLVEEIIAPTLNNCQGNISLFCSYITSNNDSTDKNTLPLLCEYVVPNLRHLYISNTTASSEYYIKNGKKVNGNASSKPADAKSYYEVEPLIPYCVQYNESFYDFLVRICNRNGEFLFCEDNKLYIGLPATEKPVTISEYDESGNYTGYDIEYNENYTDISNDAENITLNSLDKANGWPQAASSGKLISNRGIYPKEYNTAINHSFIDIYDIQSATSSVSTALKQVADARTFYDGATAAITGFALGMAVSGTTTNRMKRKFNSTYGDIQQQFSTDNKLLDDDFYQGILKNEEKASKGKLVVTSTSYKNHKLGETVTIDNGKYVVCQIRGMAKNANEASQSEDTEQYIEEFEMVLLPYDKSDKAYPFPLLEKRVRTATPQRAKVANNFDPERLGRVRISYPWQYDESFPSPWVRIVYPMASDDAGFMFTPNAGDEVLVDYENGNVERPFIVGSLYNKSTKPSWHAKTYGTTVKSITSANGHHISFSDLPGDRFLGNLFPITSLLSKLGIISQNTENVFHKGDGKYLGGGFEIADHCGFYSIKGSTDSRNITISSPLGDIRLDAYSGITINAPCGDVNITGKNVKIEAKNNLSLTSGANISSPYFSADKKQKDSYWASVGMGALTVFAKTASIDFTLMRTWVETILRPIGGTMLIKSARYMCIEAASGKADPEKLPLQAYAEKGKGVFVHQNLMPSVEYAYQNVYNCCRYYNRAISLFNKFLVAYCLYVGEGDTKMSADHFTNVVTHKLSNDTNKYIEAHLNSNFPTNNENAIANTTNTTRRAARKGTLIKANKEYNIIKIIIDSFIACKKKIKSTIAQDLFRNEDVLYSFRNDPGRNMGMSLGDEITSENQREMLFNEFRKLKIPDVIFANQYDAAMPAEMLLTSNEQLHPLKNWLGVVGIKDIREDSVWSTSDEGGILISTKKGSKFRLVDNHLDVEKRRTVEQLVESMRNYIGPKIQATNNNVTWEDLTST